MSIITRKFKFSMVAMALAMTAVVSVSYAFAANNPVDPSQAGQGKTAISGFTVTNISYAPDGTDPQTLNEVQFDTDNSPTATYTAKVQLDASSLVWYACTVDLVLRTHWTCDTTIGSPILVKDVDFFNVVIADQH
ncbi:MAG TPA: hypothetical protein VIK11_14785 [Tepidiformaceae bacterium]